MSAAFNWYEHAAIAEDPIAMFKCGYMLENGIGTKKDESRAIEMFRGAALRRVPEAQFKMASLAYDGKIPGGKAEAIRWYEKCSIKDIPRPHSTWQRCIMKGMEWRGTSRRRSVYNKIVAEETEDGDAYFMVGRMYLEGLASKGMWNWGSMR